MIRTGILVPVADNQGKQFSAADWRALQGRLLDTFGPYSRHAEVTGKWRNPHSVTYTDVSRQYIVYLESFRQIAAWLEVVDWAREYFREEAIAVEVNTCPEIFGSG